MIIVFQKVWSHISVVFGQFSHLNSFLQLMRTLQTHNQTQTLAFFLAEHMLATSIKKTDELSSLIKDLLGKFDSLRSDVNRIKKRKHKKKKSKRSKG